MITTNIQNNKVIVYDDSMSDKYTIDVDSIDIALEKQNINIGDVLDTDKIYVYTPDMKYIGSVYKGENGHAIKVKYNIMSVTLDLTNPDPYSWATYGHDAKGLTPGSDEWDEFFGHYPCIFSSGEDICTLSRYNFSQYPDGRDLPTNLDYYNDTMICFPRRGIKVEYLDENTLFIAMTTDDNRDGFSYMPHTYKGNYCDKFYVGSYLGVNGGTGQMRSLPHSGSGLLSALSLDGFRIYARNRGNNYELLSYYQLLYLQIMYLLKYKGQNSSPIVGYGYVSLNSHRNYPHSPGSTKYKPMDYIQSNSGEAMKLFGIEDFVGNAYQLIDGIRVDKRDILLSDGNYDDATSYVLVAKESDSTIAEYGTFGPLVYPIGGSAGFMRSTIHNQIDKAGGYNRYFCSMSSIDYNNINCNAYFGYDFNVSPNATDAGGLKSNYGLFNMDVGKYNSTYSIYNNSASRLMYMHTT